MNNRANPSVGIFWYDFASHSLFGVRNQEVTQAQMEAAACDGLPFIIYLKGNSWGLRVGVFLRNHDVLFFPFNFQDIVFYDGKEYCVGERDELEIDIDTYYLK